MRLKVLYFTFVLYTVRAAVAGDVCRTHDKILSAGYPAERYDVVTSDGYILEVNRIPHGRNQFGTTRRPVVFLMHGLTGCSNSFVELGPDFAMGFNFADAGFDVWLGNARGVGNSRRHVSLNPDNRLQKYTFFDFSWEDIALQDLPAMIDFALRHTGQDRLHYVGHSQGGTVFLVLNSMRPEYNAKFISAHLLAGVGYQNHFPNAKLKRAAAFSNSIYGLVRRRGIVEIYGPNWSRASRGTVSSDACMDAFCPTDAELDQIIEEIIDGAELMAGSSIKQFAHYGQNIIDRAFRRWYYSPTMNLLKYGSLAPPRYNIGRINVDIIMHYTVADDLLDERDVLAMVNDLPRAQARRVAKNDFSHVDFVASSLAKSLVTDFIIEDLRRR